ncbi:Addiction module toxin, RelE/StbE family [Bradyrhizobium sp. ORS 285]|uniref:type II toxin-antitoxin system RelE/ParE family toxin n=1 Tax=Bradyrhizobium sp. ORS 285 TaxID=115808 RepID=UPI0002406246|nr:type II toxin-antitoxin system RelE/ParE family toxin [Bradyrhizobium sp. ORS 285]CCD88382.1 Addiction module toxin, RelE/StbE family [Bradyrhizobium sp. ORS 285]SMX56869.1 Addiction module toxin, RelE/StbE family [Bradyrhizobium sp. ORS 285]
MSRRRLRWTRRALNRLDQIGAYIAENNPAAAARVVARIVVGVDSLAEHPAKGRPGRISGTRELVLTDIPYIVAYRVTPGSIEVLTVIHAAQRWPDTL